MMRASVFRLSPFLLLAATLVALAVFFAPGGQPAQAQITIVWSATLTVQGISTNIVGCDSGQTAQARRCSTTTTLTGNAFTHSGTSYRVSEVTYDSTGNALVFAMTNNSPGNLRDLVLEVDGRSFAIADATIDDAARSATWAYPGLNWSIGDTVSLSLAVPSTTTFTRPTQPEPTQYWSGKLSVKAVDYGFGCGYRTGQPQCASALVPVAFVYHNGLHEVELIHVAYGDTLQLILDSEPKDRDGTRTERSRMALNVGTGALSKQFLVKDAMVSYGIADDQDGDGVNEWTNENAWVLTWTNSGLSWSEGETRSLSLVTLPAGGL